MKLTLAQKIARLNAIDALLTRSQSKVFLNALKRRGARVVIEVTWDASIEVRVEEVKKAR